MTYDFQNKTDQEITGVFTSLVENKGRAVDIDEAFKALETVLPDTRLRVVDMLEGEMLEQAKLAGLAWAENSSSQELGGDPADLDWQADQEAEKQALLDDLECLKPMGEILMWISRIKGKAAQPLTKILDKEYWALSIRDRNDTEKVAECFAEAIEEIEDIPAPAGKSSVGSLNLHLSGSSGAKAAVAELEACDKETRERLMGAWEKSFLDVTRLHAELLKNGVAIPEETHVYTSMVANMQNKNAFGKYIAQARGAATDPLLQAYVEEAARLPEAQSGDFYALAMLPVRVVAHATATEHQQKVNKLAVGHKVRIIGKAPGL